MLVHKGQEGGPIDACGCAVAGTLSRRSDFPCVMRISTTVGSKRRLADYTILRPKVPAGVQGVVQKALPTARHVFLLMVGSSCAGDVCRMKIRVGPRSRAAT